MFPRQEQADVKFSTPPPPPASTPPLVMVNLMKLTGAVVTFTVALIAFTVH